MSIERKSVAAGAGFSPGALAIHNARYGLARPFARGARALDLACGEGLGAAQLLLWGAASVLGVDNSAEAVARARRTFAGLPGLSFVQADAHAFLDAGPGPFDLVTCVETVEHVPDPERLLRRLRARLAPGGVLLVTAPNDRTYFGPGRTLNEHHRTTWEPPAFRALCEGILGPGTWFAGTRLAGFAALPAPAFGLPDAYPARATDAVVDLAPVTGVTGAPEARALGLDGGTVFQAGLFGAPAPPGHAALGVIAADAHYEQPRPGLWGRAGQGGAPRTFRYVARSLAGAGAALARLAPVLDGKLDLVLMEAGAAPRPSEMAAAHHLHFGSLAAADAHLAPGAAPRARAALASARPGWSLAALSPEDAGALPSRPWRDLVEHVAGDPRRHAPLLRLEAALAGDASALDAVPPEHVAHALLALMADSAAQGGPAFRRLRRLALAALP